MKVKALVSKVARCLFCWIRCRNVEATASETLLCCFHKSGECAVAKAIASRFGRSGSRRLRYGESRKSNEQARKMYLSLGGISDMIFLKYRHL
jgi:hypothetical protein